MNVGYRWFDKENVEPLFAFGHGLSYTSFEYSGLKVAKAADGGLDVTAQIKNTGGVDSDEVPQVYLGLPMSVGEPPKRLVAFEKIWLNPGEKRKIQMDDHIKALGEYTIPVRLFKDVTANVKLKVEAETVGQ